MLRLAALDWQRLTGHIVDGSGYRERFEVPGKFVTVSRKGKRLASFQAGESTKEVEDELLCSGCIHH